MADNPTSKSGPLAPETTAKRTSGPSPASYAGEVGDAASRRRLVGASDAQHREVADHRDQHVQSSLRSPPPQPSPGFAGREGTSFARLFGERGLLRRWALIHLALFLVAAIVFMRWPEIDLAAARFFFRDGRWIGSEQPGVEGFRRLLSVIVFTLPAAAVAMWLLGRLMGKPGGGRAALVLVLALALGPGLIVNAGLKEYWGRARPSQIVEFGRDRVFTPVLVPTDQCRRNCSFASGEVAMAFGLATLGLLVRRRRWLAMLPGLGLGTGMAVARMSAGGHFLSDAIFAGLIASATGLVVYWIVYRSQAARE